MINIKIDSRKIEKGDTFVAIKGNTVDGHDFIDQAIKKGASKVVIENDRPLPEGIEKIIVNDTSKWLTDYISTTYSKEVNELNLVGITGTNGKTTSAYLTYQMLNKLGSKTAYIGTIGFYIEDDETIELPNTTPNILDLYELLLLAKEKGCKNVVMEVSSHALTLERIKGLEFIVTAFTNLTQDHLDFHGTMENYLDSKKQIINYTKGVFISNADDEYSKYFEYENTKTFGFTESDYQVLDYEDLVKSTILKFRQKDNVYEIETNLKSRFNVYNYLMSLSIVNSLGYNIEDILTITKNIYPPKGRCEQLQVKNGIAVIDYAHTPDAVLKIIKTFSENKKGRIITVIGCGGDRDPKKRPIMGNIASTFSDYVIFTSDNPRTENPDLIIEDILKGVTNNNFIVVIDRKEAIKQALDLIDENDTVLILGKGHEDYQIIGREKLHLSDKEEVENYLNKNLVLK